MKIGVLRETLPGESRVALVPTSVTRLCEHGHSVQVQAGAGALARCEDQEYRDAGAQVAESIPDVDCLLGIHLPAQIPGGALAVGLLGLRTPPPGRSLVLERLPRVTRAQSLDVLSSQATVAGYKAVLLGAAAMPRFMPMLTTAAGTIRPARVLVIGIGVAGLTAIATAHRLGALVCGHDLRPETVDEVRSLGATFLERAPMLEQLGEQELILTCAQVLGQRAPVLLTRELGACLKPGTVVVDLAADRGGNCEDATGWNQITYLAPANLPALMPVDASRMFSRNMEALLSELQRGGDPAKNEILAPMLEEV